MAIAAGYAGTRADLETVCCYRCATEFAMDAALCLARQEDHRSFWCPNGHEQHFTGKTAAQRTIESLERSLILEKQQRKSAQRQRAWAEARAKGANIAAGMAKAAKSRLEHRIVCGVCPHCQRTFKQLAAHMKSKHADKVKK